MGCEDEEMIPSEPTVPIYNVIFSAMICDQEIDIDCRSDESKIVSPNVDIRLFESEQARDLNQQIVAEGKTDINGEFVVTGLPAMDYFYVATYPNPTSVENEIILHFVRISPNTINNKKEIIFLKK